jgi:pimeloyl-ACP methyl ester carboxylesterase
MADTSVLDAAPAAGGAPGRPRRRRVLRRALVVVGVLVAAGVAALYRPDLPPESLRAAYAPPPSRFVRVDGMDVHYRDEGPTAVPRAGAPTVVLLHGMGASLHTWDAWTAALRDSLRVVRLDLPGYGLTGPFPAGDYRNAAYVAFLDRFLTAVGVGRASLAGNSMGGEIAWRFAAAHPARVERLVLVDAAGYPYGEAPPLFRVLGTPGLSALLTKLSPALDVPPEPGAGLRRPGAHHAGARRPLLGAVAPAGEPRRAAAPLGDQRRLPVRRPARRARAGAAPVGRPRPLGAAVAGRGVPGAAARGRAARVPRRRARADGGAPRAHRGRRAALPARRAGGVALGARRRAGRAGYANRAATPTVLTCARTVSRTSRP